MDERGDAGEFAEDEYSDLKRGVILKSLTTYEPASKR